MPRRRCGDRNADARHGVSQEHITNTLQKQLSVLQNEKQKLERELQHEHAEHAAAMSRLSAAFTEKLSERSRLKESFTVLENQLEAEQELIVHRMGAQARPSFACFTQLCASLAPRAGDGVVAGAGSPEA